MSTIEGAAPAAAGPAGDDTAWYAISPEDVVARLAVDPDQGLDADEVAAAARAVRAEPADDRAAAERLGRSRWASSRTR